MTVDREAFMQAAAGLGEDAKEFLEDIFPSYIRLTDLRIQLSFCEPGTDEYETVLGDYQTLEVVIKQKWMIQFGEMASDIVLGTIRFFVYRLG